MRRITSKLIHLSSLFALLLVLGCPPGTTISGAVIAVIPAAFNFGTNASEDSFAVSNSGEGVLVWSITQTPAWCDVSPAAGSTPVGGPTTVDIVIDRSGLAPGTYNGDITIVSNGGTRTIPITMRVSQAPLPPTLNVNPDQLDFGTTDVTLNLKVKNIGEGTVDWQLTENIPWLTASLLAGTATDTPTTIVITVDRTGLAPGAYTDNLTFTSNGGNVIVPVMMTVPGPTPLLNVSPTALDFGGTRTELTFNIRNNGTGTLNWMISELIPWLTLSETNGSSTTDTDVITVTVDRTGLAPGDYNGVIQVNSNGGAANVNVVMTVRPAELVVVPTTLNFGKFATDKLLTISNGGTGTVNWNINTAGFPGWLSLAPNNGNVTTETDGVVVSVNRIGLIPGQYSYTFAVTSNAGNANVTVNMNVAEVPVLTVNTGFINGNNDPLAPLGGDANTFDFTITNTGTGTLNWNINPANFPTWASLAPVAGSVIGAEVDTVTITVSRAGLPPGGYSANIPITSNGGNKTLEVTMQVPLRPRIDAIPENLDFGLSADSSAIAVANVGDPGTVLNFLVVTNRAWLFVSPDTGTSIGTSSPFKDYQTVNVSIDRSQLESTGATGLITVYALDAAGEIDPEIEPDTVTVSVEAAPLSFQTGLVRARIPSMLRFSFIMRDIHDSAFFVAPELIPDAFRIFEDGVLIEEPSETTQMVFLQNSTLTAPFTDLRRDLRTKVVLMLDYSGSMFQAAQGVGTDIQSLHELVGGEFIDNFFSLFSNVEKGFSQLAIMEFHDRNVPAQVIQDFSSDPATLHAALAGINVTDHGASAILPALETASAVLTGHDFPLIPFDDADIRAVVLLSDGRLTTPPGEIQDALDILVARYTRIFPIGWGDDVNHEPLARLAGGTGGHYYLVHPQADGTPSIPNFLDRIEQCNNDLASHTTLSYVSLGEEENVPIRFDGVLNDPNDVPDQGLIQGTLEEQNINLSALVGDISMGQISVRTPGVEAGATEVTIRADYVPRNVNKFRFNVMSAQAFTIGLVPLVEGGIVEDWTLTPLGGGTYSLTSPTPADVLPYGSFGDLVRLNFAAVGATPFTVSLFVDNSIYAADPEPKYMIYPDTIDVDTTPFLAPAFPTPLITPSVIDFGTATNVATFTIRNIGGTYPYAPATPTVLLNWLVDDIPTFVNSIIPSSGSRATTIGVDTVTVTVNRTLAPGTYSGILAIDYDAGTLNVFGTWPITLLLQITPPVLATQNTANLAFGNVSQAGGQVTRTFDVLNAGQSTLTWAIVTFGLPAWIDSIVPSSGTTTTEVDTVFVTVDPNAVGLGPVNTSFNLLSNGGSQIINVSMNVVP
jgi:hypothetical protein